MKLQANVPDSYLVERYLEEIARTYDIKWRSDIIEHEEEDDMLASDDNQSSNSGGGGQAEVRYEAERNVI